MNESQHTMMILLLYCLKYLTQPYRILVFESFEFNKFPWATEFTIRFLHFAENILEQATTIITKDMPHSLCSIYNSKIFISLLKHHVY